MLDGAIDGRAFLAHVRRVLAPALRPGGVLVMDNLSSHKVAGVREAVEEVGATLLYLPPCSPDLNPIELAFSKLKGRLRSAAERTTESLWNTLGTRLDRFAPDECRRALLAGPCAWRRKHRSADPATPRGPGWRSGHRRGHCGPSRVNE